jgi:hypothetical protein
MIFLTFEELTIFYNKKREVARGHRKGRAYAHHVSQKEKNHLKKRGTNK